MSFLARKVDCVFIMLGHTCNMSCKYCMQHPIVHQQLCAKINPEIYDFLKQISEENGFPARLQFYGGEPLLYFKNIKEIVEHTKGFCCYSIITNGRAMTDDMVEFFNDHDFPVTISWDGPNVLRTRGFDSFNVRNPLRRRLLRLNRLGLSAVMSSLAYPKEVLEAMQEISDEYMKLHNYPIRINMDEIFDTGLPDPSMLDVDYKRVEREIADMTQLYISSIVNKKQEKKDYTKLSYISGLYYALKHFYGDKNGVYDRSTCCCGNGYSVLNLDLAGNLYSCHNTGTPVGTIKDDYFSYLQKIIEGDTTLHRREMCKKCLAVAFCQGGCKLLTDKVLEDSYCKLKRAVFVPVLSTFQKWGGENGG